MDRPIVLVIGAGIGGIAVAARLARSGCQVTVVEKNEGPGGRCSRIQTNGHSFVTGPSLFLMPEIYKRTFADLGERLQDHIELQRVDPTYCIHFHDGSSFSLTSDLTGMKKQLERIEQGSFDAFLRYLREGARNYHLGIAHLVDRDFRSLVEYCHPGNLYLLLKLRAMVGHYRNIGRYFNDPRLKAAFTFQDMYLGLNPFEASAIFSLLQYSEFTDGVWFPKGGMYRVIEAMVKIADKNGVRFLYNQPVTKIDIDNQATTGVTLSNGRKMKAQIVIANADLPYVYRDLLPDSKSAKRLYSKKYSCSAIVFYWGLDREYRQLGPHHLFLSRNYRRNFDMISKDLTVSDDPSFYLHAPRSIDPSSTPAGHDSLMVIVPVGHIDDRSPQNWEVILQRTRKVVLRRLSEYGLSDFEKHTKFELHFTPVDWKNRFNLVKGATHGLNHNVMQMAYLRPKNRHPRYHNLYFVGASTHPGTGLPTVLTSARLTSDRIFEELKLTRSTSVMKPSAALSH